MAIQTYHKIKTLHEEFCSLKEYKDKLKFFDKHFGILPFNFPVFHPKLNILFDLKEIELLNDIYVKERASKNLLLKRFIFSNEEILFDITPETPYRQILNDYILEKFFRESKKSLSFQIKTISKLGITNTRIVEGHLNDTNKLINILKDKIKSQIERSYRNQFMNVFYEGYEDSNKKFMRKFPYKKKFIELYLYAQGVLFHNYSEKLSDLQFSKSNQLDTLIAEKPEDLKKLKAQFNMLKSLGIIDFLKYKYTYMKKTDLDPIIAETVCKIIGENINCKNHIIYELQKD